MLILVVRKIYRYFTFTAKVFRNFLRDYKSVHRLLRVLVNMKYDGLSDHELLSLLGNSGGV